MIQPEPIELLSEKLKELSKALRKSDQAMNEGKIDQRTNFLHHQNLIPKIENYKRAVELLKGKL